MLLIYSGVPDSVDLQIQATTSISKVKPGKESLLDGGKDEFHHDNHSITMDDMNEHQERRNTFDGVALP